MSDSADQLLRRLHPTGGSTTESARRASLPLRPASSAPIDFAALIARAEAGQLGEQRPVSVAKGVELDATRQASLVLITDRLEAAGSRRALVAWPDVCCELNVEQREVVKATPRAKLAAEQRIISGIDAVVFPGESAADASQVAGVAEDGATAPLLLLSRLGDRGFAERLHDLADEENGSSPPTRGR